MTIKKDTSCLIILGTLVILAIGSEPALSTSMLKRNVAKLVQLSEIILVGKVENVTDGLQNNIPYTEVTIKVSKNILGSESGTYTFRQFGLLRSRDMGNGMINMNVSPDGWPKFRQDEQVMVFLYQAAQITGLRTTVGLMQGKFGIVDGRISNAINNMGLFDNLSLGPRQLSKPEQSLLQNKRGPMDADSFINLITRAVDEGWFK